MPDRALMLITVVLLMAIIVLTGLYSYVPELEATPHHPIPANSAAR